MHALSQSPPAARYAIQVRVPHPFAMALKTVAGRQMMTISVFVRHLLVERLKAEGIDPTTLTGTDDAPTGADQMDGRI